MKRTVLTPEQERALVQAARQDVEAFTQLYRAYFDQVYGYFFLRVRDHPTAEDLTATVFEKVLRGLGSYQPERGSFGAWLFGIARHVWADAQRRLRRTEEAISLEEVAEVSSEEGVPEEVFLRWERQRRLDAAMAGLSPREREIITLKFGGGLTNRETAPIMGVSESNVSTIVYRAVRKIRDQIKEEKA